jgi:hypothetical protein
MEVKVLDCCRHVGTSLTPIIARYYGTAETITRKDIYWS